jgi:hypothetical protein
VTKAREAPRRRLLLAAWTAASLLTTAAPIARAGAPLEPREVREQRLVREDHPLWREALGLPNDLLLLVAWPLKKTLIWAEAKQLDDRIRDVVLWPIRRGRGD